MLASKAWNDISVTFQIKQWWLPLGINFQLCQCLINSDGDTKKCQQINKRTQKKNRAYFTFCHELNKYIFIRSDTWTHFVRAQNRKMLTSRKCRVVWVPKWKLQLNSIPNYFLKFSFVCVYVYVQNKQKKNFSVLTSTICGKHFDYFGASLIFSSLFVGIWEFAARSHIKTNMLATSKPKHSQSHSANTHTHTYLSFALLCLTVWQQPHFVPGCVTPNLSNSFRSFAAPLL